MNGFRIVTVSSPAEMEDAYWVRDEVFTKEQNIDASEDQDGLDPLAAHVVAYVDERPVGTGRVLFRPETGDAKIGRMAVLFSFRRRGIGRAIIRELVEIARRRGARGITLGAQESASGFYASVGFRRTDETFMEVGIPHVTMIKDLTAC